MRVWLKHLSKISSMIRSEHPSKQSDKMQKPPTEDKNFEKIFLLTKKRFSFRKIQKNYSLNLGS